MALTDIAIRSLKPQEKPYKVFDGGGLYLEVTPNGSRLWRLKYRFLGKEKRLAFGAYPEVALAGRKDPSTGAWVPGARDRREEARRLLATGVDPSARKSAMEQTQRQAAQNSFEAVGREWFASRSASWVPSHSSRLLARLENDVFPLIGPLPVSEIAAPALLELIRRVEARGCLETAHRVLTICGQIMRYAVATGRAARDVSTDLRGALPPAPERHLAAITDPARVGLMLLRISAYQGTSTVRGALQLAPLLWVRPGELRHARWADIDLDAAEWRFQLSKTKADHVVPLSRQAVATLQALLPNRTRSEFVFPGGRSAKRPMSDNAVLSALRSLGIAKDEMSGHGVRAMARTIGDEVLRFRPDYIEHQLGHAVRDPNGRAYNRTAFLPERHKMMQEWADYLDSLLAAARSRAAAGN